MGDGLIDVRTPSRFRDRLAMIRLSDERGFSMIEMMGALSIIAVGFFTLALTASTGARLLGEGRQRQAASEIASRQLEHLRNIPYDQVALLTAPSHSTDPENPDYHVSADGTEFDRTGNGDWEDLIIESDGQVPHTEDVTVGVTELTAYQYVTWVDDPSVTGAQDYKRLTIVAFYRAPVSTGRPREVRVSALFTPGTVIVEGDEAEGTTGSTSTPTPSPSPTPSGPCGSDTTAPTASFEILSGTGAEVGYTASTTATIEMSASDPCSPITVRFSNDNVTYGTSTTYNAANPTVTWTLTAGDGTKNVWAQFRDGVNNLRTVGPVSITVDSTPPTTPGTLSRTISCSGSNRTVTLSWGASTDANLVGYRVFRSIDGGAFTVVTTTAGTSASNTHAKNLDSVRFKVASYDKAGNQSEYTNEIALSKNQCS